MDIFLTHVATIDSIHVLHKYTCIELKTDRATEQDLTQILRYADWLSRKLASGDDEMIQSALIARGFADPVIGYVQSRRRIEDKSVRLISYSINEKQEIKLNEVLP